MFGTIEVPKSFYYYDKIMAPATMAPALTEFTEYGEESDSATFRHCEFTRAEDGERIRINVVTHRLGSTAVEAVIPTLYAEVAHRLGLHGPWWKREPGKYDAGFLNRRRAEDEFHELTRLKHQLNLGMINDPTKPWRDYELMLCDPPSPPDCEECFHAFGTEITCWIMDLGGQIGQTRRVCEELVAKQTQEREEEQRRTNEEAEERLDWHYEELNDWFDGQFPHDQFWFMWHLRADDDELEDYRQSSWAAEDARFRCEKRAERIGADRAFKRAL